MIQFVFFTKPIKQTHCSEGVAKSVSSICVINLTLSVGSTFVGLVKSDFSASVSKSGCSENEANLNVLANLSFTSA